MCADAYAATTAALCDDEEEEEEDKNENGRYKLLYNSDTSRFVK
jgi:hypothetical protein